MIFKMKYGLARNNYKIPSYNEIHSHNTRNQNDYATQTCNSELAAANFFVRCFRNFNNLPDTIKNIRSIKIFKNRLRELLFSEMCQEEIVEVT